MFPTWEVPLSGSACLEGVSVTGPSPDSTRSQSTTLRGPKTQFDPVTPLCPLRSFHTLLSLAENRQCRRQTSKSTPALPTSSHPTVVKYGPFSEGVVLRARYGTVREGSGTGRPRVLVVLVSNPVSTIVVYSQNFTDPGPPGPTPSQPRTKRPYGTPSGAPPLCEYTP